MKVDPARKLLSRATAAALRQLVEYHGYDKELLTTAFFCEWFGRWYDLVNSRSSSHCFSKRNEEKYREMLSHLDFFAYMVQNLKFKITKVSKPRKSKKKANYKQPKKPKKPRVGQIVSGKPFKNGIALSTASMKTMIHRFLDELGFDFLLGSRFATDCAENLFSQVRDKNPAPTPLEFQKIIKQLIITGYMKPSKYSSYLEDDPNSRWLTELKDVKLLLKEQEEDCERDCDLIFADFEFKDFGEESGLANCLGYMMAKTICTYSFCEACKQVLVQDHATLAIHDFIKIKSYKEGCLHYPTKECYEFFSYCESTFTLNPRCFQRGNNVLDDLVMGLCDIGKEKYGLLQCHIELLVRRFFLLRMNFEARAIREKLTLDNILPEAEEATKHASKSMGGFYQP